MSREFSFIREKDEVCFRKALELNPNTAWAHINLAWYLATAADPKLRARESLVRVLFSHDDFMTVR